MSNKILFVDTETGGLDPQVHSLLSIAFLVWEQGEFLDKREFLINDGVLNVSPEAMKINKINLNSHILFASEPKKCMDEIDEFLNIHFSTEKITLCGHNVSFDVNFMKAFWKKSNKNFNLRFSHRYVDTSSILFYLHLSKKLPKIIASQEAFDFFHIVVPNRHSALGDVLATAELFNKLLDLNSD